MVFTTRPSMVSFHPRTHLHFLRFDEQRPTLVFASNARYGRHRLYRFLAYQTREFVLGPLDASGLREFDWKFLCWVTWEWVFKTVWRDGVYEYVDGHSFVGS